MCGSTAGQDQIQQEQISEYEQMQKMTADMYAKQQEIYKPMEDQFQSIFAKGPGQEGFSEAQKNDLNSSVVEGTAENSGAAERATNEQIAAEGGDSVMPSGGDLQLQSEVRQGLSNEQSREESQVKEADYNQGYSEWQQAGGGLMAIAAGDNPLGYANATTSSGSAASTTAEDIAKEQNSWINAAIGAAGSAVGMAAGGWAGGGFKTP